MTDQEQVADWHWEYTCKCQECRFKTNKQIEVSKDLSEVGYKKREAWKLARGVVMQVYGAKS